MAFVKEYDTIDEAVQAADRLYSEENKDVYVLAYKKGVTANIAERSKAEKIGPDDIGIGCTFKNLLRGKGDALRSKMEEIGLSSDEAHVYEQKLAEGKILIISKNKNAAI